MIFVDHSIDKTIDKNAIEVGIKDNALNTFLLINHSSGSSNKKKPINVNRPILKKIFPGSNEDINELIEIPPKSLFITLSKAKKIELIVK